MNTLILIGLIAITLYVAYYLYCELFKKLPLREHSQEMHSYLQASLSEKERDYYETQMLTKRQYRHLVKRCLPQLSLYLERVTLSR